MQGEVMTPNEQLVEDFREVLEFMLEGLREDDNLELTQLVIEHVSSLCGLLALTVPVSPVAPFSTILPN
jgi:hypothetical protein